MILQNILKTVVFFQTLLKENPDTSFFFHTLVLCFRDNEH